MSKIYHGWNWNGWRLSWWSSKTGMSSSKKCLRTSRMKARLHPTLRAYLRRTSRLCPYSPGCTWACWHCVATIHQDMPLGWGNDEPSNHWCHCSRPQPWSLSAFQFARVHISWCPHPDSVCKAQKPRPSTACADDHIRCSHQTHRAHGLNRCHWGTVSLVPAHLEHKEDNFDWQFGSQKGRALWLQPRTLQSSSSVHFGLQVSSHANCQ